MIYEQINKDLMVARKNKDKERVIILSTLKGELGRNCDGKVETLSDKDIVMSLKRMISNLEIALGYDTGNGGMPDTELKIYKSYVPEQMPDNDVLDIIGQSIEKYKYGNPKSYFGSVMKDLKPFSDRVDMKRWSKVIKEKIENV